MVLSFFFLTVGASFLPSFLPVPIPIPDKRTKGGKETFINILISSKLVLRASSFELGKRSEAKEIKHLADWLTDWLVFFLLYVK